MLSKSAPVTREDAGHNDGPLCGGIYPAWADAAIRVAQEAAGVEFIKEKGSSPDIRLRNARSNRR